jgi:prephenate dehydratase
MCRSKGAFRLPFLLKTNIMKIAIQGVEGCFHQIAANKYFGYDVEVNPCLAFDELIESVKREEGSDLGIMAIENSIAGSLLQNYKLLQKNNLKITGEVYLRIEQNLIASKGVKIDEIEEIHSHSMAIYQCDEFLNSLRNVKLIEMEDTALSVKNLKEKSRIKKAAIGSNLSADIYGMEIIKKSIETNKKNYTRFLIISRNEAEDLKNTNKASIYLEVAHEKGSLAKVLHVITNNNINLSKLQSYPIVGSDWLYYFHLDLEYDSYRDFENMTLQIKHHTISIKVLGNYKKGTK